MGGAGAVGGVGAVSGVGAVGSVGAPRGSAPRERVEVSYAR